MTPFPFSTTTDVSERSSRGTEEPIFGRVDFEYEGGAPIVRCRAVSRIFSDSGFPTIATPTARMTTSSIAASAPATSVAVRHGRTRASAETGSTGTLFSPEDVTILPRVFVSFEGLDGSGKTTQADLLRAWLEQDGRTVVATREPGGTPLGERVRELLLDGDAMTPWAEAALFTAARAELFERVIEPALADGADVVSDRYVDSSLAYQGIARGLGVDHVLELNRPAIGDLLPDRTFLLRVDAELAGARSAPEPDRIEREGAVFRERVEAAYDELAGTFADRIVAVDGSLPPKEIAARVAEQVRELS